MNGSGLEKRGVFAHGAVGGLRLEWFSMKKKKKKRGNRTTLLQGPLKGKRKSHITPEAPIVLRTKPEHIRCLQIPRRPASERRAESLHRKIQIVSRAVRLLEHKLMAEALLSLSNILSIIHKEEGKIKRFWLVLKKKVLDCVGLHMA